MKRVLSVFLIVALYISMLAGCADNTGVDPADGTPELPSTPVPTIEPAPVTAKTDLIGFVVKDETTYATCTMMYGFLQTAAELGNPSMLLKYDDKNTTSMQAVQQGIDAGCKGMIILNPSGANDNTISFAKSNGLFVISAVDKDESEADVNVYVDSENHQFEMCNAALDRMTERSISKKGGRILIYGYDPTPLYEKCLETVKEFYPQYGVLSFRRTTTSREDAINELAEYLLTHRGICSLVAIGEADAAVARDAREKIRKQVENKNIPEEASAIEGVPNENGYTLPEISTALYETPEITIFGNGFTDENIKLIEKNAIRGASIIPYYDIAVNCVMLMDRLLKGETLPSYAKVNRPIVRQDTLEKYMTVYGEVKELFNIDKAE